MTLSLIQSLKAGVPAPKVLLLPDALFFVRAVPVLAGATQAEAATQVELALETMSPFPPAQLYHGFYWVPGAERALIFAAYRRRFTSDQVTEWEGAELVLPAFVAVLGAKVEPATAVLVASPEALTVVFWDSSPVPAKVLCRPLAPEASEADRAAVREEMIREIGGTRHFIDLPGQPVVAVSRAEREFVFRAGEFSSSLNGAVAATVDVRDRAELAAYRRSRGRDVLLWRVFLGCTFLLALLALGEIGLVGSGLWQKTLGAQANAQRPLVEKIMTAQSLTTRIRELSTRRLRPFEMILLVSSKKPEAVTFLRTTTNGLYSLTVDAKSNSPGAVSAYQALLTEQPFAEKVEVRDQRSRDNIMTFTLNVTFRPNALSATAPAK